MPGDRNSEWQTLLRCLALLRHLLVGIATDGELIAIIREFEDPVREPTDNQLRDKLSKDLKRLRELLGCDVQYNRSEKIYSLITVDFPLIDLPDDVLRGLAFLQKTFSDTDVPHRAEVIRLIDYILRILPKTRSEKVAKERGLLEIDLRSRDSKPIDEVILEKISYACSMHQEIEFLYRSPKQVDGRPRRHRVEPYHFRLEPLRRHYILEAFHLEVLEPYYWLTNKFATFRLERISELKILPKRFVPRQLKPLGKEITYRLSPEIARLRDVTEYIPNSVITYLEDGSAEVQAVSYNLFMDLRTLLHYGSNCEVIGGEEARRTMKELVTDLVQVYGIEEL